jgi:Saxitoxin biosynthesis operon protein SxtJ
MKDQNRSYGLLMAGILLALAGIRYVLTGNLMVWAVAAGAVFLVLALAAPALLAPVRRAWMKLAAVLGAINSRILLTLVFGLVVTPMAYVLRLLGKQPMRTEPQASYWRKRNPDEFTAARMERQF